MKPVVAVPLIIVALSACEAESGAPEPQASATVMPAAEPAPTTVPAVPAIDEWALTCTTPVKLGDSLAEVRRKFAAAARTETLTGAEGMEYQALVLWGDDPARRLELPFDEEEADPKVTAVSLGSPKSRWKVRGVAINDPLASVAAANGKPFTLSGFDWDYGGQVTDWRGGKLAPANSCGVVVRFQPGKVVDDGYAAGDSEFASTDPKVARAHPVVDELGVVRGE